MDNNENYLAVLKDLEEQKRSLQREFEAECAEIDQLISGIKKRVLTAARSEVRATPVPLLRPSSVPALTGMSIRWAILTVLGEFAGQPMSVGEIIEALKKGGLGGDKLRNNVGAVLSRMVTATEVVNTGNSYRITERGKGALAAIQMSRSAPTTTMRGGTEVQQGGLYEG